jgi:hypothetical protein
MNNNQWNNTLGVEWRFRPKPEMIRQAWKNGPLIIFLLVVLYYSITI